MQYGPGASAKLWRQYFPNADIWFGEYDAACVAKHKPNLDELGVNVVTGDQANNDTLYRWLSETGGQFDVIIDDGGHMNHQIYNSFTVLFNKGLKPGGIYFIEDLVCVRHKNYRGTGPNVMDAITDWIEGLASPVGAGTLNDLLLGKRGASATEFEAWRGAGHDQAYTPKHKLPIGIVSIDCSTEICALTKCTADDERCPEGFGPEESLPW